MMQQEEGEFWSGIWDKVALYGELTREDGKVTFKVDRDKVNNCPGGASKLLSSPMFEESTSSARKKGWDWSGDTYISVYSFTATSLEEVDTLPFNNIFLDNCTCFRFVF